MSELEDAEAKVDAWLLALADEAQPCGPDLEYDNEFLALTQAAAGRPESQFGPAEPPEWQRVAEIAASLFERTRDLRVAVTWMRAQLHLQGYGALVPGLKLVNGLLEQHWEHVHPLPDPDDGDPYGRVNALTELREQVRALGDVRDARVVEDRSIGVLRAGDIESALGLAPVGAGRDEVSTEQARRMLEAALDKKPGLRAVCNEALAQAKRLVSQVNERLGSSDAPDLRPLTLIVQGVAGMMPKEAAAADDAADDEEGEGAAAGGSRSSRGLSGTVNSRDEAVQAIDLVIAYLERAEPTNPAPLFLRRARQLLTHNFLQLMKVLAPDSLAEVARMVGIDPDTVEDPDNAA
jgi:type VI secretion system protein ImpA